MKYSLFDDIPERFNGLIEDDLSQNKIEKLFHIYNHTDWRCVLKDNDIDYEYNGISVISIFKALVLPFLVNIPYERNLWRVINKYQSLQELCGFNITSDDDKKSKANNKKTNINFPKERTFWHFRKKYENIYSDKIIKVLISIILDGDKPNLGLPFVNNINYFNESIERQIFEWKIDQYRPPIYISIPWDNKNPIINQEKLRIQEWEESWKKRFKECNSIIEYKELVDHREKERIKFRKNKIGFIRQIAFPIFVKTSLPSGEDLYFELFAPDWLNPKSDEREMEIFTVKKSEVNSYKENYDKACNILIIRNNQELNKNEILLSLRNEKKGLGEYAAPGGKQKYGESLENCAKRELKEETDLKIIESRPISLYYTRKDFMGGKQIMSIGLVVTNWEGELKTLEPENHVEWKWFSLDNLPQPLFEFTKIAIDQYLEGKYPNLKWNDVEEKPNSQLLIFKE